MKLKLFDAFSTPTALEKSNLIAFLDKHLGQYGDTPAAIGKAIDYALKETPSFGGFVLMMTATDDVIVGAVVVNKTGMQGYIPENILVYIATHKDYRGKGIGKELMELTLEHANGDIALHVEQNNPAKRLYERFGFTNPYLEMRLKR